MGNECTTCGAALVGDEAICAHCRTEVEREPAEPVAGPDPTATAGPPPEGIHLIIEQHIADAEILRDEGSYLPDSMFDTRAGAGRHIPIEEMVRPERDRHGRIIVDRTHALIGAVVVAIAAGLVFWYVSSTVSQLTTP